MDDATVLVEKLKLDGRKIDLYLRSLSVEARAKQVYTEGTLWTVRNVIAHLMSAERAFIHLFRGIQNGEAGVEASFSIDDFNAREQLRNTHLSFEETLTAFQETRARMVDLVATFTAADLEKTGRHPFLGVTSLREMVKMLYVHDQTHLRDIRKAIGSV